MLPTQIYHPAKFHRPVSTHAGDICYKISADKQTKIVTNKQAVNDKGLNLACSLVAEVLSLYIALVLQTLTLVLHNECLTLRYIMHFYRATACNAIHDIAFAILSLCPSDARIVTKLNDGLWIF